MSEIHIHDWLHNGLNFDCSIHKINYILLLRTTASCDMHSAFDLDTLVAYLSPVVSCTWSSYVLES